MKLRNWLLRGMLIVAVLLAGWLAWSAARAAVQARRALADVDRLQAASADPSLGAVAGLQADLAALETHLAAAERSARPFLWLAPHLGWLPRYGSDVAAAPALLRVGVQVAGAGRAAVDALAPAIEAVAAGGGAAALPQAVAAVRQAGPQLADAQRRLDAAVALRAGISGPLDPRLAGLLDQLDRLLPLAQAGLQVAAAAPGLLGADGPRAYLVLAQNSYELRATGGYISGVGVVRFDKGDMVELKLSDSYAVDDLSQPHPAPPAPLAEQMGTQLLLLRDSNWSPDFPQTAEVARALYAQDQGIATDGAAALDLEAVRLLVAALGPLQVPGVDEPVTGENAIDWMKRAWQSPAAAGTTVQEAGAEWWVNRKDFMGELVAAALGKLESGAELDAAGLAGTVLAMLGGRHLQIAVDDPVLSRVLAERGWDGGLRPPEGGDFLAVVDSNVGYNKANAAVRQQIAYRVEPSAAGLSATLTITYTHTAPSGTEQVCDRTPRYGDSYDEMVRRCYWDYLRVYVPGGSELLASEGLDGITVEPGERNTTVFAGAFNMRPSSTHRVVLRYALPDGPASGGYRLFVRKQAGTLALPLRIEAGACRWTSDLGQDRQFLCKEM